MTLTLNFGDEMLLQENRRAATPGPLRHQMDGFVSCVSAMSIKRRGTTHSRDLSGRGAARAEDAQGTPSQSHISPSILAYGDCCVSRACQRVSDFCARLAFWGCNHVLSHSGHTIRGCIPIRSLYTGLYPQTSARACKELLCEPRVPAR